MSRRSPSRRRPGRPARSDRLPDEAEILARGLEAFSRRSFEATSVRDLARALGVSHNFINDRYGSKEAFWRAVVDHSLAGMQAEFRAAMAAPAADDLERLRRILRQLGGAAGPRPELQQMLNFEAGRGSSRLLYIFERYIQPFTLELTPVIARLVRDGVLRPVPWHVLLFLITAPRTARAHGPLADLLGRPRDADDETAEVFAELILDALRARPDERGPG